jgi:hypothetical protein
VRIASLRGLGASEIDCLNRANNSPQVKAIDAEISHLNIHWRPSGYYRPEDILSVLGVLGAEAEAAGAAIAAAPDSTRDALQVKREAFNDLLTKYKDKSRVYEQAYAAARSAGAKAINAPAFKEFVIRSMRAISDGYVTAAVLHCQQSWAEAVLDRGYRGVAKIGEVAVGIVGVVVAVGEKIVDAATGAAKLVGFIVKWGPYAAAFVGGFALYTYGARHGVRGFIPKRLQPPSR